MLGTKIVEIPTNVRAIAIQMHLKNLRNLKRLLLEKPRTLKQSFYKKKKTWSPLVRKKIPMIHQKPRLTK